MDLATLRKQIVGSRIGLALAFGLPFGLMMFLFQGRMRLDSLVIYTIFGLIFGVVMTINYRKKNGYFISNVLNDKYDVTKKYTKLFKNSKIPDDHEDLAGYLEYLEATKYTMSGSTKTALIMIAVMVAILIIGIYMNYSAALLVITLFNIIVLSASYLYTLKTSRKIAELTARTHTAIKNHG